MTRGGVPLDSPQRLYRVLAAINALRYDATLSPPARHHLDQLIDGLFDASCHLIVYGSLAPGEPNHHQLASLSGQWQGGWITGELVRLGWGTARGFPAIRWSATGSRVDAKLFVSQGLPCEWTRLDAFEGPDYRRIIVPFHTERGIVALGNVYASP